MPKHGFGRRRPEDSPGFNPKRPMADTDLETRTYTRPGEDPYVRVYKNAKDYGWRDPPPDAGLRKKRTYKKQGYGDLP